MFKYILKRIVAFIPTLLIISLLAFVISINAPGDPVERLLRAADSEGGTSEQSSAASQQRQELRKELGLDRPVFYMTLGTLAQPDTLYRIPEQSERKALTKLVNRTGNWETVSRYYLALQKAKRAHGGINPDALFLAEMPMDTANIDSVAMADELALFQDKKNQMQEKINRSNISYGMLMRTEDPTVIETKLDSLQSLYAGATFLAAPAAAYAEVRQAYEAMSTQSSRWKSFIPTLQWHGYFNQYHLWLFGDVPFVRKNPGNRTRYGMIRGDFGKSFHDGQPIRDKIGQRVMWSLLLAGLGIFLAYLISVPIGILSAYKRNGPFDRISSIILFILYSLPVFFVGTWLLYMFANPDNLVWFPESGIMDPARYLPDEMNLWQKIQHRAPFFVLPVLAYTYGSFAFLSRIMRVGMIEVFGQDYIRTARAKGLPEKSVVLKHALRNSLIPIITVFADIFPVAIGGSIIIEMIFSYPGMGVMIYEAVINQDYPVIVSIFTILGFFTMIGYLVSDVLYGIADPRISYK
ncbi:MAG: ABC transporter permease subunit [Bacteroidetes bacterium]|nr:ABC transporter permease subunit [Bacteroidota bacterium]